MKPKSQTDLWPSAVCIFRFFCSRVSWFGVSSVVFHMKITKKVQISNNGIFCCADVFTYSFRMAQIFSLKACTKTRYLNLSLCSNFCGHTENVRIETKCLVSSPFFHSFSQLCLNWRMHIVSDVSNVKMANASRALPPTIDCRTNTVKISTFFTIKLCICVHVQALPAFVSLRFCFSNYSETVWEWDLVFSAWKIAFASWNLIYVT